MATQFTVTIAHPDPPYARQAAQAALAELDRIEEHLSRFAEGSDVFRINRLSAGRSTAVHRDTLECLEIAVEVQRQTGGAFDVAFGSASPADRPRFVLEPEQHAVRVLAEEVRLDLGGIGKGFALDRMAALLDEWEIAAALLCASTSTVLALGPPPGRQGWAASIGPAGDRRRFQLCRWALGGSGRSHQGDHIFDPRSGRPVTDCAAAVSGAAYGALADALSTAFMVMPEPALRRYCAVQPQVWAYRQATADGPLVAIAPGRETA
jgi:thiamine biosynthesis lipoprotein